MKKGLISFAVCATLLAPNTFAKTVQTSTDNNVSLYGEIKCYVGWTKQTDFMDNTAYKSNSTAPAEKDSQNKTKYDSYMGATTIGIDIENKVANLEGKIEGDFSNDGDVFGLTYAYVQHNFDNDLFVLIGKTDQIGEENTLSNNDNAVAGFNGTDQVVQIRLGGSFDLGSITLTPEIALEDIKDILIGEDETNYVNRTAFPGIGAKISINFETGFGDPARVYGFCEFQNLRIVDNSTNEEKSKTPYVYGVGFDLPIDIAGIQAEYLHGKGTTNYAGIEATGDLQVPGGYYNENNKLKARKFDAYNIEISVSPTDIFNIYGGYDYVRFKKHISESGSDTIKDTQTVFGGINLATTKYSTLSLEWDHFKTKYYPSAGKSETDSANQLFLLYDYAF